VRLFSLNDGERVETDVLVLGGGVAGHRAAAAARALGHGVVLAYTAHGASPFLFGCNAPIGPGDSPEAYAKDMIEAGGRLNDPRLVRALAFHAAEAVSELAALGVPFARDASGPCLRHLAGNSQPRSLCVSDGTGKALLDHLRLHCRRLGVVCWSGWRALVLLQDAGSVIGALLARPSGEIRVVLAGAVVLAVGGVGRLYADSTYPADVAADSCALAFRAGATLLDMEFVQFEPTITVHPEGCRGMEMPTAMLGDGAHLLNAQGERFMLRYNPGQGERYIEKARMALCIQQEIDAGRGLPDGSVWMDTTVLPRETLEGYVVHCRRLREAGLDPAAERPRIRPAAHSHMGGICIDANGWTGVPGLYAGGEAAGGLHGASRIAGNGGADAIVFGDLAGRGAADAPAALAGPRAVARSLEEASACLGSLLDCLAGVEARDMAATIQGAMSRWVGLHRDRDGLTRALAVFSGLEAALAGRPSTDPGPADWLAGLSARNMLLAARMIAQAALDRTESRGAHQRRDHPGEDDRRWLRHICFRAGANGEPVADTVEAGRV
jgi:succinate dehydrogenase/fumarate reductase flavoprotein subunit